jgi:hypothetical protein
VKYQLTTRKPATAVASAGQSSTERRHADHEEEEQQTLAGA